MTTTPPTERSCKSTLDNVAAAQAILARSKEEAERREKQKNDEEQFAKQLADSCKNHGDWLTIIRFGLGTLTKNQPLLMKLILEEAGRWKREVPLCEVVGMILADLKLQLREE